MCKLFIISENEMGGLRGLGRLRGLRRVGVRAAPAIVGRVGQVRRVGQVTQVRRVGVRAAPAIVGRVGQVGRVGGQAERAFVGCLFFVNCSLILRLTFGERLCDLEV